MCARHTWEVHTEFDAGVTYVVDKLDLRPNKYVNLFETTIRVLGGLLGAYHLSGDGRLVDCAHEIGTALLAGFDSPSAVPYADVNLFAHKGVYAECTLSMDFAVQEKIPHGRPTPRWPKWLHYNWSSAIYRASHVIPHLR